MVDQGDTAPERNLRHARGGPVDRKLQGRKLVVYFYPKDDTSGCTKEAQEFTALAGDFEKAGTAIVGISKDSVASHTKFTAKYDLKIELGSDADGAVCEAFGTWVEKSMYGRKYMGIERATFLIDADGKVARVWRKVKVAGPRGGPCWRPQGAVMAAPLAAFLIVTAFLTATLSGIFGMAGGLVLMGALAFVLPVSAAFVTHGILQLVANGWRAVLHREHIVWPILLNYAVASAVAGAVVALVSFAPSKPMLFLLLGLVPMLVWLPKSWLQLDAKPPGPCAHFRLPCHRPEPHCRGGGTIARHLLCPDRSDPPSDRGHQGRHAGVCPPRQDPCLWRASAGRRINGHAAAMVGVCAGHSRLHARHGRRRLGAWTG